MPDGAVELPEDPLDFFRERFKAERAQEHGKAGEKRVQERPVKPAELLADVLDV